MKTLFFVLLSLLVVTACSQSKDIYINGSEGSHSGLKYDPDSKTFVVN